MQNESTKTREVDIDSLKASVEQTSPHPNIYTSNTNYETYAGIYLSIAAATFLAVSFIFPLPSDRRKK